MQNLDVDVKVSSFARKGIVLLKTFPESSEQYLIASDSRRAWYNTRRAKLAESLTERAVQDAFNLILIGNYKERVIGGTFAHYASHSSVLEDPRAKMLDLLLQYASIWTGTWSSPTSHSSTPPFPACSVLRSP